MYNQRPCSRCGKSPHNSPDCKPKCFRVGTRVLCWGGRIGTIVPKPKWLVKEASYYVEWEDGRHPKEGRAFPGWLTPFIN